MRVSTNSMFIAALATSTSMSCFVNAAPTTPTDGSSDAMATSSEAAPPPAAPGAPDLTSILGSLTPSTRRAESLDARQLGLMDDLSSLVDIIFQALGLKQQGGASTSAASATQLSPDQVSQITNLLKSKTGSLGLPLPLAVPLLGRSSSGVQQGSPTPSMDANHLSRRAKPDWMDRGADHSSGPAGLHVNLGRRSGPDWKDHASDPILPLSSVGPASLPVGTSGLPVETPVQPPTGFPPSAGTSQGNNSATLPSLPAGVPLLPIGAPSLPFGDVPSSPIHPPTPPNPPAQAASMNSFDAPLPVSAA